MTTETTEREIEYRDAVNEALHQEMERDTNIILMGEEMAGGAGRAHLGIIDAWGGAYRTTRGLIQKFGPGRVRDTPLSEGGFIGAAIGAASSGLRPIAELMYCDFIGVCMDQILNNAAKMKYMYGGQVSVPLTLMTRVGAGSRAAAQHSESLYSILVHIPGLKVVLPSDAYTAKGLLISAIRDNDPVIFMDHKSLYRKKCHVPEELYTYPIGKARTVRKGKDITLVGISAMTWVCTEAADILAKDGIEAEVIDVLSVSPLDYDHILESVRKTEHLVIVDEDNPRCSVATDIAATVADEAIDYLDAPIKRVTAPHTPVPYNPNLEQAYIPNAERVLAAAKLVLDLK